MKLVGYPARIYRDPNEEDEVYLVEFPGLGGGEVPVSTYGESLEHAREMAVECLTGYILSADGDPEVESPRKAGQGEEIVYPDLPVAIALTVRAMRQKAGLSQTEAAGRLGVAQPTYSRWESPEKCNASVGTLEKIAKAFGRRVVVSFPEAS